MSAPRLLAIAAFVLTCSGLVALVVPLFVGVGERTEGRFFLGGLAAAAVGTAALAATVVWLVRVRRPEPALRRRVRDACLRLGIFGLLEAALWLTRRSD